MKSSNTQTLIESAWPNVQKVVDQALGKPDDELPRKFLVIDEVNPTTRIMLTKFEPAHERIDGNDEEWEYSATALSMHHLRTVEPLTHDDLRNLSEKLPPEDVKAKIAAAVTRAQSRSLRRMVLGLIRECRGVFGPARASMVGFAVSAAASGLNEGVPCSLLLPSTSALRDDEAVKKELNDGKVVVVPPQVLPHPIGAVLTRHGATGPVLHEAIAMNFGHETLGPAAYLVIEHRFVVEVDPSAVVSIVWR